MENTNDLTILQVSVRRDTAEQLQAYAGDHGITVGALLRGFVMAALTESDAVGAAGERIKNPIMKELPEGEWLCRITDRNAELIKAEYARHNPEMLGPDELVNEIIANWFRLLRMARE